MGKAKAIIFTALGTLALSAGAVALLATIPSDQGKLNVSYGSTDLIGNTIANSQADKDKIENLEQELTNSMAGIVNTFNIDDDFSKGVTTQETESGNVLLFIRDNTKKYFYYLDFSNNTAIKVEHDVDNLYLKVKTNYGSNVIFTYNYGAPGIYVFSEKTLQVTKIDDNYRLQQLVQPQVATVDDNTKILYNTGFSGFILCYNDNVFACSYDSYMSSNPRVVSSVVENGIIINCWYNVFYFNFDTLQFTNIGNYTDNQYTISYNDYDNLIVVSYKNNYSNSHTNIYNKETGELIQLDCMLVKSSKDWLLLKDTTNTSKIYNIKNQTYLEIDSISINEVGFLNSNLFLIKDTNNTVYLYDSVEDTSKKIVDNYTSSISFKLVNNYIFLINSKTFIAYDTDNQSLKTLELSSTSYIGPYATEYILNNCILLCLDDNKVICINEITGDASQVEGMSSSALNIYNYGRYSVITTRFAKIFLYDSTTVTFTNLSMNYWGVLEDYFVLSSNSNYGLYTFDEENGELVLKYDLGTGTLSYLNSLKIDDVTVLSLIDKTFIDDGNTITQIGDFYSGEILAYENLIFLNDTRTASSGLYVYNLNTKETPVLLAENFNLYEIEQTDLGLIIYGLNSTIIYNFETDQYVNISVPLADFGISGGQTVMTSKAEIVKENDNFVMFRTPKRVVTYDKVKKTLITSFNYTSYDETVDYYYNDLITTDDAKIVVAFIFDEDTYTFDQTVVQLKV